MIEKTCADCRHTRREQTGPHEYFHFCSLQQRDFTDAAHCAFYQPGATHWDAGERWPCRDLMPCRS